MAKTIGLTFPKKPRSRKTAVTAEKEIEAKEEEKKE